MQNDPIITHERILDKVTIEGTYIYSTYTTIGLTQHNDFYIKLEFINLDAKTFAEVKKLYELNQDLTFVSDLVTKLDYDITHIITERFNSDSNYLMTWECLSDKPGPSLII